jgi:CrcB protein
MLMGIAANSVLADLYHRRDQPSVKAACITVRAAVTFGFIGGLTTYSNFNYETMRLFEESAPATAVLNLAVTMLGGLMAGWLGVMTAREVLGR